MSEYFAANPDHAILVGVIGFFALAPVHYRDTDSR